MSSSKIFQFPGSARGLKGFPKTNKVTLKYCESVTFTGAAGSLGTYFFNLNSCYDPNNSGTGHQPLGFDQWSTFYNRYVVEKVRFKLTPLVTSASINSIFGWYITDDTTLTATTSPALIEQGRCNFEVVLYGPTNTPLHYMTGKMDMRKWFDTSDLLASIGTYGAKVTADPSDLCILALFVQDYSFAGSATVRVLVEIEFDVIFVEPKELPQS